MTELMRTPLNLTIDIRNIITMFYFELGKDFVFTGESHDFWEMVYVDAGEIGVGADERRYLLSQGSLIFHKPNEFHDLSAVNGSSSNVIVLTFDCSSEAMDGFANRVFKLNNQQKYLLGSIINEGTNAFAYPFRYPIVRKPDPPPGSEQLIKNWLEILLILLLRDNGIAGADPAMKSVGDRTVLDVDGPSLHTPARDMEEERLVKSIIAYLEQHITARPTLSEISSELHISTTKLKEQFKRHTGQTIMEYLGYLRIERAKQYIREEMRTVTELSELLGYSSVHYFSASFKKAVGMGPSEYAKSIQVLGKIDSTRRM
ncbi:helix-turn-helix domain-containing protein [Paenibacillus sp. strain BS8-2]